MKGCLSVHRWWCCDVSANTRSITLLPQLQRLPESAATPARPVGANRYMDNSRPLTADGRGRRTDLFGDYEGNAICGNAAALAVLNLCVGVHHFIPKIGGNSCHEQPLTNSEDI